MTATGTAPVRSKSNRRLTPPMISDHHGGHNSVADLKPRPELVGLREPDLPFLSSLKGRRPADRFGECEHARRWRARPRFTIELVPRPSEEGELSPFMACEAWGLPERSAAAH